MQNYSLNAVLINRESSPRSPYADQFTLCQQHPPYHHASAALTETKQVPETIDEH